jgi:nitrate/TMAO reductase-like tetraheme cytochrome c subunit
MHVRSTKIKKISHPEVITSKPDKNAKNEINSEDDGISYTAYASHSRNSVTEQLQHNNNFACRNCYKFVTASLKEYDKHAVNMHQGEQAWPDRNGRSRPPDE